MQKNYEIVGILNVTPDSFSDGGRYKTPEEAIEEAALMFEQGASWVDVGGESTRPGATPVEIDEEWRRIQPVLDPLIAGHNGSISIDSLKPLIFDRASACGSFVANVVNGFWDPEMIEICAELGCICVNSHLPLAAEGDVERAHNDKTIIIDSEQQIVDEQMSSVEEMIEGGISKEFIKLDPGVGFAKTWELNRRLVGYPQLVADFDVFIGFSRKSSLKINPKTGRNWEMLDGMDKKATNLWLDERSVELALEAVRSGAKYIRAHNVPLHKAYFDLSLI